MSTIVITAQCKYSSKRCSTIYIILNDINEDTNVNNSNIQKKNINKDGHDNNLKEDGKKVKNMFL